MTAHTTNGRATEVATPAARLARGASLASDSMQNSVARPLGATPLDRARAAEGLELEPYTLVAKFRRASGTLYMLTDDGPDGRGVIVVRSSIDTDHLLCIVCQNADCDHCSFVRECEA